MGVVSSCFLPNNHSAASRRQSSTTMLALLILGALASAQKDDFGFGGAPRRPPPPPADKPKPLWFVPDGPATKENCNTEGEAVLAGDKPVFESPTSEIFVPEGKGTDICIFFAPPQPQEWQLGKGVSYNSRAARRAAASTPRPAASGCRRSRRRLRRTCPPGSGPAGGCDAVPSSTTTSRLILNKDNNDSGDEAALCVKSKDADTFELLTGETTSCKGKCCVFLCKSCKAPES